MNSVRHQQFLSGFTWLTAFSTLVLVGLGGVVTSKGVGMAVPDWPTSFGYNMFALPFSTWLTGGVFDEHTHRLVASIVGTMVVALTRWLGGARSRKPLMLVGLLEIVAGFLLLKLGPDWKGAGYFLSGIGGVVFVAGLVWLRNPASPKPLPAMAWTAFVLVQLQGLLGGLRVVLDAHFVGDLKMGVFFGILHGCLGQAFLVVVFLIPLFCSRWWRDAVHRHLTSRELPTSLLFAVTLLIFVQLMLGATMRHQHAGLAVPDFPLAHGQIYPATDPESIRQYNRQRTDYRDFNPITAAHIHVHMMHRLGAVVLLVLVPWAAVRMRRSLGPEFPQARRLCLLWIALIVVQAGLGIVTLMKNKPADFATLHVVTGALCLATGALLTVTAREFSVATKKTVMQSAARPQTEPNRPATRPAHS